MKRILVIALLLCSSLCFANPYYTASGFPVQGAQITSAPFRAEYLAIQAGFNAFPSFTGNNLKYWRINASATGVEAVTPTFADYTIGNTFSGTQTFNTISATTINTSGTETVGTFKITGGTNYGVAYQNSSGAIVTSSAGSPGQVWTSNGTSAPAWQTATASIPQNIQNGTTYTFVLSDANGHIYHASGGSSTFTIPANSSVAYPIGTTLTFVNMSGTMSIGIGGTDTLILVQTGTTGTRSLTAYGMATAVKITATSWLISGGGLS